MKCFVVLYCMLDCSIVIGDKCVVLVDYFCDVLVYDVVWVLFLLFGGKVISVW